MTYEVLFSRRMSVPSEIITANTLMQSIGTLQKSGKVQLSLLEARFLLSKNLLVVLDAKKKPLSIEQFDRRAEKFEHDFWVRSHVFCDLRERGYVVKTGLKYGADFTVYDRGVKPGEDHAKWLVYPVHEAERFTWHDLSAKNRIAHTTKKRLLLGVVDDEGDVTYFELRWVRP